ncbi:hypothetical protein JAO73_12985 [Hymenobacter sp. BT523]|uniref:DUF6438 domain-containing protein n=1 Tax=Hymenobacter sp. BT523 TaxID=2795725 RepID=UPI0018ECAA1B|nr:DUF6438 domain-containing protein [Hymenobacter sp. BT523]MBJ6109930.1 hypothetical protein [Hymenobacter sp. BT523]
MLITRLLLGLLTTLSFDLLGAHPSGAAMHKNVAASPRSQLDGLTTDAQVLQFVNQSLQESYGSQYQAFYLLELPVTASKQPFLLTKPSTEHLGRRQQGSTTETYVQSVSAAQLVDCSGARSCFGARPLKSWLKADFDSNGRNDLLVYGHLKGGSKAAFCFMDQGVAGIKNVLIDGEYGSPCYLLNAVQVRGRVAIQRAQQSSTWSAATQSVALQCQLDTLVFAQTRFIPYNAHPSRHDFQKLVFSTTRCYGRCPVFQVEIDRNRLARYEAIEFPSKTGVLKTTIDLKSHQELWVLLGYINFMQIPDNQHHLNIDLSTYTLAVTDAAGHTKTVQDSDLSRNPGLRQVFDLLLRLPDTQSWK